MLYALFTVLPMLVCAFTAAEASILLWQTDNPPLRWLQRWAATATVLYAGHLVFFHHSARCLPLADSFYLAANLAVFPLYLIYICRLTTGSIPRWLYALLAVSLAGGVGCGVLYALMSPAEVQQFVDGYLYRLPAAGPATVAEPAIGTATTLVAAQTMLHHLCKVLFTAAVLLTLTMGRRHIRHYNRLVEELYADTDDKQLRHIGLFLHLLALTAAVSIVFNAVGRQGFADSPWVALPSLLYSTLLFAIGQAGLRQRFSFDDILFDERETPAAAGTMPVLGAEGPAEAASADGAETAGDHSLAASLRRLMAEEQLFLQPNLKLHDICLRLGTNRTYLQSAMKEELDTTFSEYVNRLRIAYARELGERHPELSRTDIAIRSGYASPTSFYRNWKLFAETPAPWPSRPDDATSRPLLHLQDVADVGGVER